MSFCGDGYLPIALLPCDGSSGYVEVLCCKKVKWPAGEGRILIPLVRHRASLALGHVGGAMGM